jgi:hypothetical protein
MRLPRDEDALLRQLYLDFRIPIDQYRKPQRHAELAAFIQTWNDATGRSDAADEVLRYMMNQRKSGEKGPGWPTFDGDYDPLAGPRPEVLTEEQWNHLREIYTEMFITARIGSDELAFNGGLRTALAREFHRRTGRRVSGELLHALIEAKRKRGLWVAFKPGTRQRATGFKDINEVG